MEPGTYRVGYEYVPQYETGQYAAEQLGVDIGEILLVAAHDWDITGAIRVGARGAFIARRGMLLGDLSERPDFIGPDLGAFADELLGHDDDSTHEVGDLR